MITRELDRPETVEMVMALEEIRELFENDFCGEDVFQFEDSNVIVDYLEQRVAYRRPKRKAVALLRKLAKTQRKPGLVEGLDGTWRREQIAALIQEILK